MNIFYLDPDPKKAAQYHCDKHVVKMILESAQLLSTTKNICGQVGPYKTTHQNHPSAVWTRFSRENYLWLGELLKELCEEYTHRYGKIHKTAQYIPNLLDAPPLLTKGFGEPPQCMPDQFKNSDTVAAYRNYYNVGKSHLAKWSKREKPSWYI